MTRAEFQALAALRAEDAQALLAAGRWAAAYYLAGYAVECGLKAVIARRFLAEDVPEKDIVLRFYSHDLVKLVTLADLMGPLVVAKATDAIFKKFWGTVVVWSEQARYTATIDETRALAIYEAVTDPTSGVLQWLTSYW